MKAKKVALFGAVLMPAFLALAAVAVHQARASCFISWDGDQPTCVVAQSDRSFSYNLETSWASRQGNWYMYLWFIPGNSPHISNGSVTPESELCVADPAPPQFASGTVGTTNAGTLDQNWSEGTFQMAAFDHTYWNCSDSYDVTIKASGGSCN